ncbi:MAG: YfhO family protein, partial [Candidatus Kapabacteria bacterium]|nr:YfhO family protein [Candidatus Kapabacteria bacterium]
EGSLEFQQITNFVNPHQFGKISGDDVNQADFNMKLANGEPAPYFYYWETAFYFGVVVFLLGLIGIVACKKNKFIQFLLIMTALGLLHALGSNFFIHGIFYELPFFGQFRNPARMMVYVVFAFSIFASFGFDKLFKSTYNEMKISIIISASLVALLILIAFSSVSTGDVPMNTALMSLLYFAISIAIIFMISTRKIGFTLSGFLLILVLFIDLYLAGGDFNASKEDPQLTYKMEQNMLKSFKPNPPDDIFRVNTRSYSPPYMATKRNQGMIDRFMNTEGYNPLVLQRVNPSLNETDEIYDLLNVKYILKFDTSTNQPYFEENHDRLPNAWLVNRAHIFPADQVGEKMKKGSFDFSKEVILEEPLKIKLNSDEEIKSKVVCKEYKTNYLRYEILNPESNVVLVLSEIWYPSWKVFVDGLPAKLHRANYSLRAVEIPKGASKIELRFASESFAIGQWITLVTLLISLPLLVINLNKRKKNA